MLYIQNLSKYTHELYTTNATLAGILSPGDSVLLTSSDNVSLVHFTNGMGSVVADHTYCNFGRVFIYDNPSLSSVVSFDWVYVGPLIVWAIWLLTRMILRLFARSFGARVDNVVD